MKMKCFATLVAALGFAAAFGFGAGTPAVVGASENAYGASDWMPYNYVMTSGFGLNTRKNNIRTELDYAGDQLVVKGNTAKGGVGVTFLPEVDLANFSVEFSLDHWRVASPDKWLGITFMDKGQRTDPYNEVPFYSKHSESWSNDYGAGALICFRPYSQEGENAQPGVIELQFNYIGINHSFTEGDVLGSTYNEDAGKRSDGMLYWAGYLCNSPIQLCDRDWNPLTDLSDIKITIKETELNGHKGYALDYNDGYWYRPEDSVAWPTPESDAELFAQLDIDASGTLDDWERKLFSYGPAYYDEVHDRASWIPYANYGDPFHALYNFNKIVEEEGGQLYFNMMYKDAFDMPEGENAQFTVKRINGKAPTRSETTSLTAPKEVSGSISATVEAENFYAGVYPSMIDGLETREADAKTLTAVLARIEEKKSALGVGNARSVSFFGRTGEKDLEIISPLTLTCDLAGKQNFAVYEIDAKGKTLKEISATLADGKASFAVKDSQTAYVLFYDDAGAGGDKPEGGGCRSAGSSGPWTAALLILAGAGIALVRRRE